MATPEFQARLATTVNPYGNGGASQAIVATLEALAAQPFDLILKKRFQDLEQNPSASPAVSRP